MELYNMGDASYVTHAVMMVTHALAVTSLPVRIARSEVRRALPTSPIRTLPVSCGDS